MTELERMQYAQTYLTQLANGIDPLTGREIPEHDTVNNVRISRCLFYVSDILRQVIENGGIQTEAKKERDKAPFALSAEARDRYAFGEWPVTASVIALRLNELVDLNTMQKLKTTSITGFLTQSGLLFEEETPTGRKSKRPTAAGRQLGISTTQRTGQDGTSYTAVIYSREAQQFLLDNLDAVIAINNTPRHENQNKPWTPEDDAQLRQMTADGADIKQLSDTLKRSRSAIRARLEKLGLAIR